MLNKFKIIKILSLALLNLVAIGGAYPSEALPNIKGDYISTVIDVHRIEHGGKIYTYQKLKVTEKKTNEYYGSLGQLLVKNYNGLEVLTEVTRGQPGCSKSLPPIKIITIDVTGGNKSYPIDLLMLCSSDSGLDGMLKIYDPSYGFVAALHFKRVSPSLEVDENQYFITVENEMYIDKVGAWSFYPVIYQLKADRNHIYFNAIKTTDRRYSNLFDSLVKQYRKNKAKFLLYRIYLLAQKYDIGVHYELFKESLNEQELNILNN